LEGADRSTEMLHAGVLGAVRVDDDDERKSGSPDAPWSSSCGTASR
jgi:hypothetical protein